MTAVNDLLATYSEEIRLRLALLINGSSVCVNCLVEVCGLPQPTISRHLSTMRHAGVCRTERKGQHTYYTLEKKEGPYAALNSQLADLLGKSLISVSPFKEDRERLLKQGNKCTAECVVS